MCVGTMDSAKLDPAGTFRNVEGGLVVTGSSVDAMIERVMSWFWESVLRISSGPKASSALYTDVRTHDTPLDAEDHEHALEPGEDKYTEVCNWPLQRQISSWQDLRD